MPQIKEYRQQTSAPGPAKISQLSGSDISGNMGKNLASLGDTISGVNDFMAKREMQKQDFESQKLSMQEQLDISERMEELKRTAPAGAEGFTEAARAELDKRKQKALENAPSEFIRQNLEASYGKIHYNAMNEAMQFEAQSMAKKSKDDVNIIANRTRNSVRLNPATVQTAIESMNALIDKSPVDETTKQLWKSQELNELRQNEVRGWIDVNPYKAKEMLEKGTWDQDLSSDLRNSLVNESEQGIRALEIERNRQKSLSDEVADARREATKNDFLERAVKGELSANEVVKSNLKTSEKEHILRGLKTNAFNMANASNPTLFNNIVERIHLPEGHPNKISTDEQAMAFLGKGLNYSDLQHIRKEISGAGTPEGKMETQLKKGLDDIAKGKLTKSNAMGFKDPDGDEMLQRWRIFAAKKFEEGKKKGLDPVEMLDPSSKDYIGKHLNTPMFQKTNEQIMKATFSSLQPPGSNGKVPTPPSKEVPKSPPRAEGESPAQYLERLKKGKREPSSVSDLPDGWGRSVVNGQEIITPPSGFALPRGKEHYDMNNPEDVQNFLNESESDREANEELEREREINYLMEKAERNEKGYEITKEELDEIDEWNKKHKGK